MNNIKRFGSSLAILMIASGLAMTAPALAKDGHSGETESSDTTTTEDNTAHQTGSDIEVHNLANRFKQEAKTALDAQNLKTHTEAERQKACTARKTNLTKRMNNAVSQAKKHKTVFDNIYAKVKAFHDTKNLNVPNYDALVASVDSASGNAQTSIDALSSLDVSVDCTSQTVASSVGAFQQAVKNTRDSLKAYRSAITDLIKAIKGASTSSDNNSSTNSTGQ